MSNGEYGDASIFPLPLPSLVFIRGRGGRPEPGTHREPGSSLPWRAHLCSLGEGTGCTIHHLLCNDTRRLVPLCFPVAGIYHPPFLSPPIPSPHSSPPLTVYYQSPLRSGAPWYAANQPYELQYFGQERRRAGEPTRKRDFFGPVSVLPPLSWKKLCSTTYIRSECA